jgi:hypothetical protein
VSPEEVKKCEEKFTKAKTVSKTITRKTRELKKTTFDRTNSKLNSNLILSSGIEPGLH